MKRKFSVLVGGTLLILCCFIQFPHVKAFSWDLLNEPWDDFEEPPQTWLKTGTGTSEIEPVGQHHLECFGQPPFGGSLGRHTTITGGLPEKYSTDFYVIIDSFGSDLNSLAKNMYNGHHRLWFRIYSDKITILNSASTEVEYSVETDNNWHTWRLVVDSSVPSVAIYRDGELLHTFTDIQATAIDGLIEVEVVAVSGTTINTHEEYWKIASGLHPSRKVTFYFNVGGILRVDNVTISNSSFIVYENGTTIELASLPQNSSYVFLNFTWNNGYSLSNPYNFTIIGTTTLWLYLDKPSSFPVGLIFGGITVFIVVLVIALAISKH